MFSKSSHPQLKAFPSFYPQRKQFISTHKKAMISQAIFLATIILLMATEVYSKTCPTSCGNLTIPFPFGTSPDCYLDESFLITCNQTYNPPRLFLTNIEVLDISLDGLIRLSSSVASDCSGAQFHNSISFNFPASNSRNKFTAVGCDTYALVDWKQMNFGCVSSCDSIENLVNGTCSGIGCCQTSIPNGVRNFSVDIRSLKNHTRPTLKSFNPCSFAFVVEDGAFKFSSLDLKDLQKKSRVPVVLDWSVGNVACQEAWKNRSSYACRANHSECSESTNGVGYRCSCLKGFEGNPYLADGCRDIDECATLKPCEISCENSEGSYSCSCPKGLEGDGKKDGQGCHSKTKTDASTMFYIISGFMVPAIGSSWIFWRRKQKKVTNLRKKLFYRNGGKLLENMLTSQQTLLTFTAEDLKKATDNYDENRILYGEQPSGITYKGTLPGETNRIVTVKKFGYIDETNIELFITKLVTLSRIRHRNLVELIGCCLETQVPLLVYEFITVKTLYDYIHDDDLAESLLWDIRLTIAADIAGALAYIHFDAGVPIIHGNLSSSSILLHHGYTVKIHDFALPSDLQLYFGASGLLNSEYLFSGQILTVKSDVYSFGVILAELLTGKEVIGSEGEHDLVQYFVSLRSGDDLISILDRRIDMEGKIEQITQVGKLAQKCLSDSSANGPSMKEVVITLQNVIIENSCAETSGSRRSNQETTAHRVVRRNRSF